MKNVAVIGASNNEEKYANRAMKMLAQYGHQPIPVTPTETEVLGRKACASVAEIRESIDTVTLYISPRRQRGLFEQIVRLKPKRVIFNPGTENPEACETLRAAGIETVEACTLVMLRTGQF